MTERELIIKAKSGDKDAFCELYSAYKKKLYNYAFYRLGNTQDAEDAVSDCILSAYEQIGSLKSEKAFSVWLFRILYCCCTGLIKKQITDRNTDNIDDFGNLTSTDYEKYIHTTELKNALDVLNDDEKSIVLLSVIAGFSSAEISKVSSLTAGSVRSKLKRSLDKVRKELI